MYKESRLKRPEHEYATKKKGYSNNCINTVIVVTGIHLVLVHQQYGPYGLKPPIKCELFNNFGFYIWQIYSLDTALQS